MSFSTYSAFAASPDTEKIGLVRLSAARRLCAWTVYSGTVYLKTVTEKVLRQVTVDGTALTESSTLAGISAGKYYFDRETGSLYVQLSDDSDPDASYVALHFWSHFATAPVSAANDLSSTGEEVFWEPYFQGSSTFSSEMDGTQKLLGVAISGTAKVSFHNDRSYWASRFDKLSYENQLCEIYSWHRTLPITEAQLLYRGKVKSRDYGADLVSFQLRDLFDELRAPVDTPLMSEVSGAKLDQSLQSARQRRVYGYVYGLKPTPTDSVTDDGYPLTGTVTLAYGGTSISGSGTQFLKELTPGDELFFPGDDRSYSIDTVTSDTAFTITETYLDDAKTAATAYVQPSHPKRYANRTYLIAGHQLARPTQTITDFVDNSKLFVSSTEYFDEGGAVEIGTQSATISVLGTTYLKVTPAFTGTVLGETIARSTVSDVVLGGTTLTFSRDYTYNATLGTFTLDELAEFNIASIRPVTGTITISNGSRSVTGSGTLFNTEFKPGDWIRGSANEDWFEVLTVTDDTNLVVRTTPGASDVVSGGAADRKTPDVSDSPELSMSVLGKGSTFLRKPGEIIKDLLGDSALDTTINQASFDDADARHTGKLGLVIPDSYSSTSVSSVRDSISEITRSVFATLVQNSDFELELKLLEPSADAAISIGREDIVDLKIKVDAADTIRTANVEYKKQEANGISLASASNKDGRYLSETEKEFTTDSAYQDSETAGHMAERWASLFSRASTEIEVTAKLSHITVEVGDVVKIEHPKLFQRFGSSDTTRLGLVTSVTRSISDVTFTINDLGGIFARTARMSPTGTSDFSDATDEELLLYGFQTDANGLIETEASCGLNTMW